jgi:hypothetical protein
VHHVHVNGSAVTDRRARARAGPALRETVGSAATPSLADSHPCANVACEKLPMDLARAPDHSQHADTMLSEAMREELIERNVATVVRPPSVQRVEVQPWSTADASRFLGASADHRLHALFAVGVALGLR